MSVRGSVGLCMYVVYVCTMAIIIILFYVCCMCIP